MKIYTKGGDRGETGLLGGVRVPKSSPRIEAIGEVDELNAHLGLVLGSLGDGSSASMLVQIQSWLFDLGAELATPPGSRFAHQAIRDEHVKALEASIDEMNEHLAPLKAFILPGGSMAAAHLHVARCVCRRAERALAVLAQQVDLREELPAFLNRLSDWLFVAARAANAAANVPDVPWRRSEGN